jgi:hypothetical protein
MAPADLDSHGRLWRLALSGLGIGLLVLLVAAASQATAARQPAQKSSPKVSIGDWSVRTDGGGRASVGPGAAIIICRSEPAENLSAEGTVRSVEQGKPYVLEWRVGNRPVRTTKKRWAVSAGAAGAPFVGTILEPDGLAFGRYELRVMVGREVVGESTVNLGASRAC